MFRSPAAMGDKRKGQV